MDKVQGVWCPSCHKFRKLEGDILAFETDDEVINVNVFWDEEHALFMFESKKYNEQEPLAELVENNTYPFEIIGNIYENPELLENKE